MKILSIETSCDETALAALEVTLKVPGEKDSPSFKVLGTSLYSQVKVHEPYGGVFPALAKREHAANLIPLLDSLLKDLGDFEEVGDKNSASSTAEITEKQKQELREIFSHEQDLCEAFIKYIPTIARPDFDMLAVTSGPGLEPALWVGINFARALSLIWQMPLMPANHMEGHIASVLINDEKVIDVEFPVIALLISGGHTQIVLMKNWGEYEILGKTRDDAVGEAFDKAARILGLKYPGGPEISRLAAEARDKGLETDDVALPRPMLHTKDLDFSFSGLKTAVLYFVKRLEEKSELTEEIKLKIALDFENSVTEVLFKKTTKAIEDTGAKTLIIGGGVIANKHLRETFLKLNNNNFKVLIPGKGLSTDNAVMIGITGFFKSLTQKAEINPEIKAEGNLSL